MKGEQNQSSPLPKFQYSESKIASACGVSRYDMVKLRKEYLRDGIDYRNLGRNGGVAYSDGAVKALTPHLPLSGLDLKEVEVWDKKRFPVEIANPEGWVKIEPAPAAQLQVVRIPPNPRLVLAKDEKGEVYRVFVGRNMTFVIGDRLPVEPWEGNPGVYKHVGQIPRDRRRQRNRP